ncbi:MAG: hypothetical protein GX807_02630 [Erysipelotrichia bacterium]|nr:hypothetical protein [Erysipelotrichia bacterium]
MKDKLVKTNRKAAYYRFRKFVTSFAIAVSITAIVAIPVTIKLTAEQNTVEAENQNDIPDIVEEEPADLFSISSKK